MYIDLIPLIEKLEPKPIKGVNPVLAILKHGDRADSTSYIKSIEKKAVELGAKVIIQDLEGMKKPSEKILEVKNLAEAVLPIRPLPQNIEKGIEFWIDFFKDIDNFTGKSIFNNCTAEAVLNILNFLNIKPQRRVVILGRHIGLDIALTLLKSNYSPTICHSKTENLKLYTQDADVVISATGVKNLITKDMVKVNATVIDVGLGDVEKGVVDKAYVTTVKNGVGAVTTAVLFNHLFKTVRRE